MSADRGRPDAGPCSVPPPLVIQLRHCNCSRAAVDTLSDGVHAGLARSAFEAVSATNLVPINNRAKPQHPLDESIRLRMGTRSLTGGSAMSNKTPFMYMYAISFGLALTPICFSTVSAQERCKVSEDATA